MITPFIQFPGTAGNNVSTPDTNQLDANTAHQEQGSGDIGPLGVATVTRQTSFPVFGNFSTECIMNGGQFNGISTAQGVTVTTPPAAQGETWYLRAKIFHQDPSPVPFLLFLAEFTNAAQGTLHVSSPLSVPSGVYTELDFSATFVDAGVTDVVFYIRPDNSPALTWYSGAYQLAKNNDPGRFEPSLRIVGASFVSEDATNTPVGYTFSPGSPLVVGEGWVGNVGRWALHDGAVAAAPIVAQVLGGDAARAAVL